jgi:hypothetical protein
MSLPDVFASPFVARLSARARETSERALESARGTVRSALDSAISEAVIDYDAKGNAHVILDGSAAVESPPERHSTFAASPPTPNSAASAADVNARIDREYDIREELRQQADLQIRQLHEQMASRIEASDERVRAALAREEESEQRALAAEVQLRDQERLRAELASEQASAASTLAELEKLRQERGASTASAALAVSAAVEAEAARWQEELAGLEERLADARRGKELLQQELDDVSEAWQADQREWKEQRPHRGDEAGAGQEQQEHRTQQRPDQFDAIRAKAAAARADAIDARASLQCALSSLSDADAGVEAAHDDARRAVTERGATQLQAQRAVDAASEQLQCATAEAAKQVREAEARAESLATELEALRCTNEAQLSSAASKQQAAEERQQGAAEALLATQRERDDAFGLLSQARSELETLRRHLVEADDTRQETEAGLSAQVRELHAGASAAEQARSESEAAAQEAERRAACAQEALVLSQRRVAEQASALSNLQALLEQLQLQVTGGDAEEELTQLRVGGRLLVGELMHAEASQRETRTALSTELRVLRVALEEAAGRENLLKDEVTCLGAQVKKQGESTPSEESLIDKRLVASVLVKYFEVGSSREVLTVLASMLACTDEEQRALGLLPGRSGSGAGGSGDARLSDAFIAFIESEQAT